MKIRFLLPLVVFVGQVIAATPPAERPPNFIIILADDLGYGDLECQGSKTLLTPRIDLMAREGIRFLDAYAGAPYCSPSRASLLTGRLPARCGLPYVLFPMEHHGLPADEVTLADVLKARGYATAAIGKWHLGWDGPFRPLRRGFQHFYGLPYSNDSDEWRVGEPFIQVNALEPLPLYDDEKIVEAPVDIAQLTQRYTKRALEFIRSNRDRPFFLYLPHTMPHIPQYASAAFAGTSKGGVYGDAIQEIDASTGAILDELRELKIDDRTLVIFTSDNGGVIRKPGQPERFPKHTFGGDNGPLRAGKGTTFEGGIRIPLIVRWPGTIKPGRTLSSPVSLMDLFPTCARWADAQVPSDRVIDGRDLTPYFSPAVEEDPLANDRPIFDYFGYQAQAVRQGHWKLFVVIDHLPDPRPVSLWYEHLPEVFAHQHRLLAKPELYDLATDIGETKNVAAEHPEIVERLTKLVHDFDDALQKDKRPMQFVQGTPPPAPHTIRTPEMILHP